MPQAELWEAEYVGECVEKAEREGKLKGINTLIGDQANFQVLDSWIQKSGGNFDIIIDDGGHHNCQISNSFDRLWPQLNPGGYYFIEDMHVLWNENKKSKSCGDIEFPEKIQNWIKHLMYETNGFNVWYKWPLPKDISFIHCQAEACVLKKKKGDVNDPYKPQTRDPRNQFKRQNQ